MIVDYSVNSVAIDQPGAGAVVLGVMGVDSGVVIADVCPTPTVEGSVLPITSIGSILGLTATGSKLTITAIMDCEI